MPEKTDKDKMDQILKIDPPVELVFRGPYSEVNKTTLKLANPTDQRVLFKVKTTAPKSYCVRPNSGIIAGGETQEVDVMLQSGDLPEQDRSKHKFMVQTMITPNDDESFPDSLWKETPKDKLMDTRLKCVFIDEQPMESTASSAEGQPSSSLTPISEDLGSPESLESTLSSHVKSGGDRTPEDSSARLVGSSSSQSPETGQQEATTRMYEDKLTKLTSEYNTLK
jgi:hypothetical protein